MASLSQAQFAALSGCDASFLLLLREHGIVGGEGALYEDAHVNRARLALALAQAGIGLPALAGAMRSGHLSLDFADQLMFEPATLTGHLSDRATTALAQEPEVMRRLRGVMGLSELPSDRTLREDDIEFTELIAETRTLGIGDESMARVLRVFGQSVRREVEAMRELFRRDVEETSLASGLHRAEMLSATAQRRLELQRIGFRALFLLQRRLLEDAVFDNIVTRIQEAFHDAGHEPAGTKGVPTVAFADLAGFTALTQEIGDARAAEQAAEFEALAQETTTTSGGQFIKALGDGVMLLFPDAHGALDTSFRLAAGVGRRRLPAIRIGLATGPVVPRDGDIFGRTVNLAARIVAQSEGASILVCDVTKASAELRAPLDFVFEALSPSSLKGFAAPMQLYATTRPLG